MRRILVITILVLASILWLPPLHGQAPVEAWVHPHAEVGASETIPQAIAVNSAGHAVVTGSSTGRFGLKQWLTIAYDSSGAPIWTNRHHYDGPGSFYAYQANAVALDSEGNAFVTGVAIGGASGQDFVTIKYSVTGVGLWTNRYDGPGSGNDGATAIVLDGGGNVIVAGTSVGTDGLSSFFDFATVKYSSAGVPLWTNRFNGPGQHEDGAKGVAVDHTGNVFVTGDSYTSEGSSDYLTLAYSSMGEPLWTNRYNGPGNNSDYAKAVAVDHNGNVLVTGDSWNGTDQEYATIAYSGAGVPLWTNRYHAPWSGNHIVTDMALDAAGNVFVTGRDGGFMSPGGGFATIKYSNGGMPLWTNRYNGPVTSLGYNDNARAIAVDSSGNVVVTGESFRDVETSDFATISYSNAGLPLWTNRYNGPANGFDIPVTRRSLALGSNGSVYVTGASDMDSSEKTLFGFATVRYAPLTSAHILQIERLNTSVVISWPVASGSLQLQENTRLSLPEGWSPVLAAQTTNNNYISAELPAAGSRKFFRLGPP